MKLTVSSRVSEKKSDVLKVRRAGDIPAILYAPGRPAEKVVVKGEEFQTALRQMKPGQLPTTVFTLHMGNAERKAVVKDIQYHVTNYKVAHLDFVELQDKVPVKVKVPISFVGVSECIGVKLGGFLRQVVRTVLVECLPKDLPKEFFIDVRDLELFDSRRLKDLDLPKGVKMHASPEEVVVIVSKR